MKLPESVWAASYFHSGCDPLATVVGIRKADVEERVRELMDEEERGLRDATAEDVSDDDFDLRWSGVHLYKPSDFEFTDDQALDLVENGLTVL